MFPYELIAVSRETLKAFKAHGYTITTAESCTGGLISAILTEVPGSSSVVDRSFVTYSNAAKSDCLDVPVDMIAFYGAVSKEVAQAMAKGALVHSSADISVAVTGVAGPDGGTPNKPVGLVHIVGAKRSGSISHKECKFGDIGRTRIRLKATITALTIAGEMLNH